MSEETITIDDVEVIKDFDFSKNEAWFDKDVLERIKILWTLGGADHVVKFWIDGPEIKKSLKAGCLRNIKK
jgi:hypothetical protein